MNNAEGQQSKNSELQEADDELTPELEADIKRWVEHNFAQHYTNVRQSPPTPPSQQTGPNVVI